MGSNPFRFGTSWPLNKLLVLQLMAGFAMLLIETRFEHRYAVSVRHVAWTPIVVSGAMVPISAWGLAGWHGNGRRTLLWAYVVVILVGVAGFWFHSRNHPVALLERALESWVKPQKYAGPPPLAPLSFCGLGVIGVMACLT